MRPRMLTAAAAALGAAASVLLPVAASADSTATVPHLVGTAAGSSALAAGGVVYSGPTAASSVDTLSGGQSSSNSLANVSWAGGLVKTGALVTSVVTSSVPGGLAITAHARTAGLSLLTGLISADAVDTTSSATVAGSGVSSRIGTSFVNLSVNHVPVPVVLGHNVALTIPGVASIVLNYTRSTPGNQAVATTGAAAVITLLARFGALAAGAVIVLNPVTASINQVGPGYAPLGGFAYGTRLSAKVGSVLNVQTGATGAAYMPPAGTQGRDTHNPTLAVSLPGVAVIGAVQSVANGIVADAASRATLTSNVANVNLFGGVITADAITATASMTKTGTGAATPSGAASFVNLRIAGAAIRTIAPVNTVIQLGDVGTVTLNGQSGTPSSSSVHALTVHLDAAAYGLPADTDIELATAVASFRP